MNLRNNIYIYANTNNKICNVYDFNQHKKISLPWNLFLFLHASLENKENYLKIDNQVRKSLNSQLSYLFEKKILDNEKNINNCKDRIFISTFSKPLESLEIEITNRCNLKCKHCFNKYQNTLQEIDIDLFESIIKDGKKIGLHHVTLTGGEPLLCNNFKNIINLLKKYNMPYSLLTNGWYINEELVQFLEKSTIIQVNLSCDGFDSKSHDEFRGIKGSFENVIKAANILKNQKIPFEFSAVIHRNNINNLDKMINLFSSFSVPYSFDFIIKEGNAYDNYDNISVSVKKYSSIINKIFPNPIKKIDRFCGICYNMLYISSNGDVKLCPSLPSDFTIGNIFHYNLKDIWIKEINKSIDISCKMKNQCIYYDYCKGGCRSRALSLTGDINGIDKISCEICRLKANLL